MGKNKLAKYQNIWLFLSKTAPDSIQQRFD